MKLIKPLAVGEADFIQRASNGYFKNAQGVLSIAGPDETRFFYNEAGGFDGFLIEPVAKQSIISKSQVFTDTALWQKTNITIGAAATGPDGIAASATRMTASGTARLEYKLNTVGATAFSLSSGSPVSMAHIEIAPQVSSVLPVVHGVGSIISGSGSALSVPWPAHAVDDVAFLFIELTSSLVAPSGWTLVSSVVSGGTATTIKNTYWRRATSGSMSNASVSGYSDHASAVIVLVRGARNSGDPFSQEVTSVSTATGTAKSISGFISVNDSALVIAAATYGSDVASNPTSGWYNENLSAFSIHVDGVGTALGNGGGLIVASASFVARGVLKDLAESKFRSSFFVKRVSGSGSVKLYNYVGSDYAEFDLSVGEVVTGDGFIEPYYSNWWRISATKDTGFLPSQYGFGFEFTGELLVFGANLISGVDEYQYLLDSFTMSGDVVIPSTAANLIYSNIPLPDPDYAPESAATFWDAGDAPYAKDAAVIFDNHLYVSLKASNSSQPDLGSVSETDPDWALQGIANRWKMFDPLRGIDYPSEHSELIEVLIQVPGVARSVALLGVDATHVHIEAYRGDDRLYNQNISMVSAGNLSDWYKFFSEKPLNTQLVARFDLPPVPGLLLHIVATKSGIVKIGKLLIGTEARVGCVMWGVAADFTDFSGQKRDFAGNLSLIKRRRYKTIDFNVKYKTGDAEQVERVIDDVASVPTLIIGSVKFPTTYIYGIVKAFRPVLPGPKESTAVIRVEAI